VLKLGFRTRLNALFLHTRPGIANVGSNPAGAINKFVDQHPTLLNARRALLTTSYICRDFSPVRRIVPVND
jgi:hypothetical protein